MSTSVSVNTYTYSVTFVADNVQRTLKDIIVQSGLDPTKYVNSWKSINLALMTWMQSKHLRTIILEIFNPKDDTLVGRWDIEISYGWSSSDTGSFWIDTDQIKTAIRKCGAVPSSCEYQIMFQNSPGHAEVDGWSDGKFRSTDGFVKQSLGSTVEHSGLGANASYYRKKA
jgi:hypothetical protein